MPHRRHGRPARPTTQWDSPFRVDPVVTWYIPGTVAEIRSIRAALSRVGLALARIVSVLGSMFDPERVVVSGAIADGVAEVVAAARRSLPTDLDLPAPELVASTLGGEVVVTGAVAAAVASARERVLDVWGAAG
ncbi:hypothetical protein Q9S36_18815 [Microbacterium sp. ARD31]|uniref:hypothetical protein n=1 Tax=Microbacterium sp. ARD31 TaxID=2962576 RepID=UPI00288288E6|nr:hypothetical protein [Microbacterium sp. ARD31]MDT0182232.1 hypothetical protein [Microbacterium sp. ARD31]